MKREKEDEIILLFFGFPRTAPQCSYSGDTLEELQCRFLITHQII